MASVNDQTAEKLGSLVEYLVKNDYKKMNLMIASSGGAVVSGIALYNFLVNSPIEIETFNLGNVDSIAIVLYCAGKNRYCAPVSRFLIHEVTWTINNLEMNARQLSENSDDLERMRGAIAEIISITTGKRKEDIENDIKERKNLNVQDSIKYGLVKSVKENYIPAGAEMFSISESMPQVQKVINKIINVPCNAPSYKPGEKCLMPNYSSRMIADYSDRMWIYYEE